MSPEKLSSSQLYQMQLLNRVSRKIVALSHVERLFGASATERTCSRRRQGGLRKCEAGDAGEVLMCVLFEIMSLCPKTTRLADALK